jgi:hypothetical protein
MSEYTCKNGHLIPHGQYFCPVCCERIAYEDGQNEREMDHWDMDDLPEPEDYE